MKFIGLVGIVVLSWECSGLAQSEEFRRRPADWVFQPKNFEALLTGFHFERPAPTEGAQNASLLAPGAEVFSRLIGVRFPRSGAKPKTFDPAEFQATVTAETIDEQWLVLQRSLRLRLNAVRRSNAE